jgi:putative ABC transport system permease protein
MDTLMQDLRYALRSLGRRPAYTLAAVVTLGLGVGATVGIFSVVEGVLLRPLPFVDPDGLVVFGRATSETEPGAAPPLSHLDFLDYRESARSFDGMAVFSSATVAISGMDDAAGVQGAQVSADFFRILGGDPILGRTFLEEELAIGGPRAIIISYGFWQDRFGGYPDVLGQMISISGLPRPVVGVTPPGFEFPAGSQVYAPIRPNHQTCGRSCANMYGLARLGPGVRVAEARAELETIARRLELEYPATNTGVTARMTPLLDHIVGNVRRTLFILLAAGAMVMLIACANVANLVLVRGVGRSPELSLRTTLGASRSRIVRQLMTESLLLGAAGAVFGILLAAWGIGLMRAFLPPDLPRVDDIGINSMVMTFAALLAVVTTLLFGLLPAVRLASRAPAEVLRGGGRGMTEQAASWGRFTIPVVQVALAVTLLLGAGLLLRTLTQMHDVDIGFDPNGLATFTVGLPPATYGGQDAFGQFFDELRQRLEVLPGVEAAGVLTSAPHGGGSGGSVTFTRADAPAERGHEPSIRTRVADQGGIRALNLPLLEGRLFGSEDRWDSHPVVIINASAARRYWPDSEAVGRQIRLVGEDGPEEQVRTVVGVVGDARTVAIIQAAEPEMYLPYAQVRSPAVTVALRSAHPEASLRDARRALAGIDPNLPQINPTLMTDAIAQQMVGTRFYLVLIGIFAGLAAILASVGLYGVLAFSVGQRSREIGIRMALGARSREVLLMVLRQGFAPAAVGLVFGLGGALMATRFIASMLYGVTPHDPVTYMAVSVLLLLVACTASIIPAMRASRIPPVSALRSE